MHVPVAGPEGITWVAEEELSEKELSLIGSHHNAIARFLSDPGDDEARKRLNPFKGKVVRGIPLVTDPSTILDLDQGDQLTFETFYEVP